MNDPKDAAGSYGPVLTGGDMGQKSSSGKSKLTGIWKHCPRRVDAGPGLSTPRASTLSMPTSSESERERRSLTRILSFDPTSQVDHNRRSVFGEIERASAVPGFFREAS
jgi:hypothetical protein